MLDWRNDTQLILSAPDILHGQCISLSDKIERL
jgi:hypothetical protein